MDNEVKERFGRLGVRAKVRASDRVDVVQVDVQRDRDGEYFLVQHAPHVKVTVPEATPWDRHLVLRARHGRHTDQTFLCGRDEYHWFVAAIPEDAAARTVQEAKDALKPAAVWESIREHNVAPGQRDGRRNDAFVRQGEWFFIPRPELIVRPEDVLDHEPFRRGDRSKPHDCQYGYRIGGQTVYVCDAFPNGLTKVERRKLTNEQRRQHVWQTMVRNAAFYARGTVSHVDHKPIWLSCWHQVVMNRETEAAAMRSVAFLD